jgi:hypothetical protein
MFFDVTIFKPDARRIFDAVVQGSFDEARHALGELFPKYSEVGGVAFLGYTEIMKAWIHCCERNVVPLKEFDQLKLIKKCFALLEKTLEKEINEFTISEDIAIQHLREFISDYESTSA